MLSRDDLFCHAALRSSSIGVMHGSAGLGKRIVDPAQRLFAAKHLHDLEDRR
jgi:hypothetical protein